MSSLATPPTRSIAHPHLESLARDLRAILEETRERFVPTEAALLSTAPGEGQWSVLELFEHLRLTGSLYQEKLEAHLTRLEASDERTTEDYRPGLLAGMLIRFVGPDGKRKVKAPAAFRPRAGSVDDVTVLERYLESENRFLTLLARADGLPLNRKKFGSPITPLLRFTLGEGLTLMVRHQQRHLLQARRIHDTVSTMTS